MVGGALRWWPDDHQDSTVFSPLGPDAEPGQPGALDHPGIRNEVGQVVVLLEPRVADHLALACTSGAQTLERDRLGDDDPPRCPPRELALQPGELVVLHLDLGDAEQRADDRQVDGSVGEGQVEALAGRPGEQPAAAPAERPCLRHGACAGVVAEALERDPEALEHALGLPVAAGADRHLVPTLGQALDDRPQHERVSGGGAVDPDPHPGVPHPGVAARAASRPREGGRSELSGALSEPC